MSIDLSKVQIGASRAQVSSIEKEWDTYASVEATLERLGIPEMKHPDSAMPMLTEEMLTTQDNKSYTGTFCQFQNWTAYVASLLATSEAKLMQYGKMLKAIKAQSRESATAGVTRKITKEEMMERIESTAEYRKIERKQLEEEQLREKLKAAHSHLESCMRTISRQVELRKLEVEQLKLESNMPRRGTVGGLGGIR